MKRMDKRGVTRLNNSGGLMITITIFKTGMKRTLAGSGITFFVHGSEGTFSWQTLLNFF